MKKLIRVMLGILVFSLIVVSTLVAVPATGNSLFKSEKVDVFPAVVGYISDSIGMLSVEDYSYITTLCELMEPKAQIAVCIIATTGNLSIEEYSIRLAEKWEVGHKGKDDGVILVVAKNDRKLRIEVGRGLEGVLTDAKAGAIINNIIVPKFKLGQFSSGVRSGIDAIVKEIGK